MITFYISLTSPIDELKVMLKNHGNDEFLFFNQTKL